MNPADEVAELLRQFGVASAAFHAHTATGKLNALITSTGPSGCHCSIIRWLGRSLAMVSP